MIELSKSELLSYLDKLDNEQISLFLYILNNLSIDSYIEINNVKIRKVADCTFSILNNYSEDSLIDQLNK